MEEEKKDPPGTDEKDNPAPAPEESFKKAIDDIRAEYDKKIADLNAKHKQELDERTEVIKQLLTGERTEVDLPEDSVTIAEKINKKRNYEF